MSIWTEVEGEAYFHESKHISLRKLIEEHFFIGEVGTDYLETTKLSDGYINVKFQFHFCDFGESTWKTWRTLRNKVLGLAGNPIPNGRCTIDAVLTIRDGV